MPQIAWVSSYAAAVKSARASKKLIMVDFYADWCTYCKKLDAEVYTDKTVIQLSTQFVPIKLDTDRAGQALGQKLGVRGLPTVTFLDADGGEWLRLPGFVPAAPFAEAMRDALKNFRETPLDEARLKANPKDGVLAEKLAQRFAQLGNVNKALWAAQLAEKSGGKTPLSGMAVAVGGMYLDKQRSADAMPWFQKALTLARTGDEKALAHIGMALCYASKQDFKHARTELTTARTLPGVSAQRKSQADQLLGQLPR